LALLNCDKFHFVFIVANLGGSRYGNLEILTEF